MSIIIRRQIAELQKQIRDAEKQHRKEVGARLLELAVVMVNNKHVFLGRFNTKKEAAEARNSIYQKNRFHYNP